jgi:hypothetical protein
MPAIEVAAAACGVLTYLVHGSPRALPPVRMRDLAASWDGAREAALAQGGAHFQDWGPARAFRFALPDGTVTDLALTDADAGVWVAAVDRMLGIANPYGLSVCLRLLALVDLLAEPWARGLFTLRRDGAELDAGLLRLAAEAKLTDEGRFDGLAFRARLHTLPGPAHGPAHPVKDLA